jgi:predicted ester cyclase
MDEQKKTKEFFIRYANAMSTAPKVTRELLKEYIADQELIEHILFFDSVFPGYEVVVDEMIVEGSRIVVQARMKGRHEGQLNGIPPTYRKVEFPFVIRYDIEAEKIVSHWLVADQMALMEQLGVVPAPQD